MLFFFSFFLLFEFLGKYNRESIDLSWIHNATVINGGRSGGITEQWTPRASCAAQAGGGSLPGVMKVWHEAGVWCHQEQGADTCCQTHSYLNQMLRLEAAVSQAEISCSEMSASWNCATWFWSGNIPLLPRLLLLSQMKYLHDQNGSLAAAVSAKGLPHYGGMVHWQYLQPVLPTWVFI